MASDESKAPPTGDTVPQGRIIPGEDFSEDYANNFIFEQNAWDFKILFGQFDQTVLEKSGGVNWHTAITMPWGVAKVMSYYLLINIMGHELLAGRIPIPVAPPEPAPPVKDSPQEARLYNLAQLFYRWMILGEDIPLPILDKHE